MDILIYVLAGIEILLGIGGLATKHPFVVLSSAIVIAFSGLAIYLVAWWPLIVALASDWGFRLLGLEPKGAE